MDILRWQGAKEGGVIVGATYRKLNQVDHQSYNWPWKHIWKVKIPHKVACFVWLAKEAVLTQENLMKRGITLCSRCFFCGETAETAKHLFARQLASYGDYS